ncbi:hypothetical protein RCL1_004684 [Eukaryota sp. TZLM3-RCL]
MSFSEPVAAINSPTFSIHEDDVPIDIPELSTSFSSSIPNDEYQHILKQINHFLIKHPSSPASSLLRQAATALNTSSLSYTLLNDEYNHFQQEFDDLQDKVNLIEQCLGESQNQVEEQLIHLEELTLENSELKQKLSASQELSTSLQSKVDDLHSKMIDSLDSDTSSSKQVFLNFNSKISEMERFFNLKYSSLKYNYNNFIDNTSKVLSDLKPCSIDQEEMSETFINLKLKFEAATNRSHMKLMNGKNEKEKQFISILNSIKWRNVPDLDFDHQSNLIVSCGFGAKYTVHLKTEPNSLSIVDDDVTFPVDDWLKSTFDFLLD